MFVNRLRGGDKQWNFRKLPVAVLTIMMLVLSTGATTAKFTAGNSRTLGDDCTDFTVTGYTVCGRFHDYWETYGGLPIFGYPISDEHMENGLTVQYFERARFEWHPGAWPERWDVLLGRVGAEVFDSGGPMTGIDLDALRAAVAPFKDIEAAKDAGWNLVDGLDYCFDNPGVGGMGFHYINVNLLDTNLDSLMPEAMVYQQNDQGELELGAVEWIVPADAWDGAGNTELPQLMGHMLHLNEALGVYVLHAWIFNENPAGVFEDWNPNVSCPS